MSTSHVAGIAQKDWLLYREILLYASAGNIESAKEVYPRLSQKAKDHEIGILIKDKLLNGNKRVMNQIAKLLVPGADKNIWLYLDKYQ